jgi:hypothetical protein
MDIMVVRRKTPANTKEQALQIREAWTNIGASEIYGDLTLVEFQAAITAQEAVETVIMRLQDQLTNARNEYHDRRYALWNMVKRVRAGAKARHGDDSDEYERFGGTRLSERQASSPSLPEDPTPE